MAKIIAECRTDEIRIAVLEEGVLRDILIDVPGRDDVTGHIYKAVVRNVRPGMEAAFVDIGRGANAYLNLKKSKHTKRIGKLHEGQSIIVQAVKEEMLGKSARVTVDISLAGRFTVLLPHTTELRMSKKITDESARQRLRSAASPYLEQGCGFIVRTAAVTAGEDALKADMEYLHKTWEQIRKRYDIAKGATELYRDADIWLRLVRDFFSPDVDEVVVDNPEVAARLEELSDDGRKVRIVTETGKVSLFEAYRIEPQLEELLNAEVPLPSGGYLRIDRTEALTVIDVNSGHFSGRTDDAGETAFAVNVEAADEILRQLRLRNIGGIIICDFIDMPKKEQREGLLVLLGEKARRDRVKTVVCGMTSLGLVEMTRKRERKELRDVFFKTCDTCGGIGYVLSAEALLRNIGRRLSSLQRSGRLRTDIRLTVHPDTASAITDEVVAAWKASVHRDIVVEADERTSREAYSIGAR